MPATELHQLPSTRPGYWADGTLPPNARLGLGTIINGEAAFKRFQAGGQIALVIGSHCTMDGVHFALGHSASVQIGDYCYFTNAILLCEAELRIGNYVVMGWNSSIADSDFHPISPAARIQDALACSPLGKKVPRPRIAAQPVIIEDDVWIGPNATILKGVRIGAGSFIEPGSLVTRNIPRGSRVLGNPAQVVGPV
jgi:acetyltransferase-like isoleucine patch superfamily enzyme